MNYLICIYLMRYSRSNYTRPKTVIEVKEIDRSAVVQKQIRTFCSIFQDKDDWALHSGKFQKLHLPLILPHIQSLPPTHLHLYTNKHPELLNLITLPLFGRLMHLDLKNNSITSIEILGKLKAIKLTNLNLGDNSIVSIKVIRKLHIPQLSYLSLYSNRITSIERIQQTNLLQLQSFVLGLNHIANVKALNKANWMSMLMISLQNNRICGLKDWKVLKWNAKVICG